jgi:hypothetical protein
MDAFDKRLPRKLTHVSVPVLADPSPRDRTRPFPDAPSLQRLRAMPRVVSGLLLSSPAAYRRPVCSAGASAQCCQPDRRY